jgi:ligand-binding SRPBCC domain-containing protein
LADHILESRLRLPHPREAVFEFFASPENLGAVTPRWLHFSLLTPRPIVMAAGTVLDYRIRWLGVPLRWRSIVREYDPPYRFVDAQILGPYSRWEHRHMFFEDGDGTVVEDRITYRLPLGPLGKLAHVLLVGRQLEAIFSYRREKIAALLTGRTP